MTVLNAVESFIETLPLVAVLAAAPDVTAPLVTLVSPAPDAPFDKDEPIVFDVTDNSGILLHVEVRMNFSNGACEAVYNGAIFKPFYRSVSTKTPITNGFRFSVRRLLGGFPSTPTLEVDALDAGGNRN